MPRPDPPATLGARLRYQAMGLLPGARPRRRQIARYADEWDAANERALAGADGDGPLWVVLGDSTSQGIGASSREAGYVLRVLALLRAQRDPGWRVVNLAVTNDRTHHVVERQLPALGRLPVDPALVTCAIGANDLLLGSGASLPADQERLVSALPAGAVVATIPQGVRPARAEAANAHLRALAATRDLPVADVWARTGPPWHGKFSADHIHPNDRGYTDWVAAFADALSLTPEPPAVL